ncbi:uncharacterized protein LOC133450329 isoform X1 [Cololabis saira]|uniref:uncharacterized protein LOC133450329 isoform X1 n=1 Tax=Cololabis saira TaxID=129043 RepID=UPI002AD28B67|nr:uncharacterized protein LOC133450329 isoform X1 [Cololabis saira]
MAFDDLDQATATYISCIMYLLVVTMKRTTDLLAAVMTEERRRRQIIRQGAIESMNLLMNAGASLLEKSLLESTSQRSCWMRVRSKDWWERVVLKEFSDKEWKENFRMTRRTFDKLCGLMSRVMKPEDVTVRAPVPLQMRVAIVLYKLASSSEYRVVANQFGVHKSTVKKFVYIFCKGMVSSVIQNFITVPTAEEAVAIARRFELKFNIPQIIGCIGGTHIPVLPPSDGYKDFINRKGWTSYVLQAVVDDTYRFWNINCKLPGSADDADVLRQSALFSHAHQLPKGLREINGVAVSHFLVGDPGYPLMEWLIKDYTRSPSITPEQESFNVYLSSARTTVQIAFGRLKSRWRVLLKRSDFHFTFTPHVIATCCALHNLCEDEEDGVNPSWTDEAAALESNLPQPGARAHDDSDTDGGQKIRELLTDYLSTNFPLHTLVVAVS